MDIVNSYFYSLEKGKAMNKLIDISSVTLRTERLTLRPFKEEDIYDFYDYTKVDGVGEMAGWSHHKSIEESEKILSLFIKSKNQLAIVYNDKAIGSIGIEEYKEDLFPQLKEKQGREIGYVLSKDYWGEGIMKEGVEKVIEYLFNEERLDFITISHFQRNARSKRVIEKLGLIFSKDFIYTTQMNTEEKSLAYILYNPAL